jgi:hypothetical protein
MLDLRPPSASEAEIFQRWASFQRALDRPEPEITWHNCKTELDLDKRTRCQDCGTMDGVSYMVRAHVWAATGLAFNGGGLCFAYLARRLGRPLRLD